MRDYSIMACFLHVFMSGCMDYVKLEDFSMLGESYRLPPVIDSKHIYPHPTGPMKSISVGKKCNGQTFKVPPIADPNKKDRLYYYWFIDDVLAWPESIIEPESRKSAIITLTIDEQFLLSHFQNNISEDFYFPSLHTIKFVVSDTRFAIPEIGYIENGSDNENQHSDSTYWIVSFTKGC